VTSRRVLITGANGFVGRHLIAHLLARANEDYSVTAAVRPEELEHLCIQSPWAGWTGCADSRINVVPFELCNAAQVGAAVRAAEPDWIVHLAARSSGAAADREAVMAVNVDGTRNVLEAASDIRPYPRTLIISTGYVYGSTDPARPAREDDPIGPLWRFGPYADSKIEMESVARAYRAFAIIARPFAHTGPGQPPAFAVPAFARQLARIEAGLQPPVLRVGNLAAKRDMLDARDVVRAYERILHLGEPGDTYNVARGAPAAVGDVLDELRSLCHVETEVQVDPERLRPADIACSSGDPLKLWTATGWSPRIAPGETLRDTLDYWRAVEAPGTEQECAGPSSR